MVLEQTVLFFITFGIGIVAYILIGSALEDKLIKFKANYWEVFKILLTQFLGTSDYYVFYFTQGSIFILSFVFIYTMLLYSFMIVM